MTNGILDSGATCHTTREISDFVLGSMVERDNDIEVTDGIFSQKNKRGKSKQTYLIKMANLSLLRYITHFLL